MSTYRITADTHQWIVNRVLITGADTRTPGRMRLIPLTYHPSLELAVRALCDRVLRDSVPENGWDPSEVPGAVSTSLARLHAALDLTVGGES